MLTLTKKVLTKPNHETPSVTHFGSRIIINLILKLRFVQNTTNQKLIFKSSYLKLVLSSFILVAAPPTTNKQTITIIKSRNHLLSPTFHCGPRGCSRGLSIYYVSSYNKAGSVGMLMNAYLREQGFIKKLMSYENQH